MAETPPPAVQDGPDAATAARLTAAETLIASVRQCHPVITVCERCEHEVCPEGAAIVELDDGSITCSTRTWRRCEECCFGAAADLCDDNHDPASDGRCVTLAVLDGTRGPYA